MTDLAALLARVEGASGPDREIDGDIATAFNWRPQAQARQRGEGWYWFAPDGSFQALPAYTASLDAVVALAEQVLRGWWWGIGRYGPDGPIAKLAPSEAGEADDMKRSIVCKGATPALALVAAIIRAKMGGAG